MGARVDVCWDANGGVPIDPRRNSLPEWGNITRRYEVELTKKNYIDRGRDVPALGYGTGPQRTARFFDTYSAFNPGQLDAAGGTLPRNW
jgi:glutamate dehydrogenase (NAD(P)+)